MSSLSDQAIRGVAEFRPATAVAIALGLLVTFAIAVVEHSPGRWIALSLGFLSLYFVTRRFRKESRLIRECTSTIATVTSWKRAEGTDGGSVYTVGYRFVAEDGHEYTGNDSSHEELPREGQPLRVSYARTNPGKSLPMDSFWFYRFTYSGFAAWTDRTDAKS